MALQFFLDGLLTDSPINENVLSTSIVRDSDMGALLVTQDAEIIYANNNNLDSFTISGYDYLKGLFEDGICEQAELKIFDQVSPTESIFIYVGIIKMSTLLFDEQRQTVSSKVKDNSFYAYIDNNKSIKVNVKSIITKSREAIAPTDVYQCDLFATNSFTYGSTFGIYYYGHRISDIFRFILGYISDNKIAFKSDYIESPPDGIHLFLFNGSALANEGTQPFITVSFQQLFDEIFKAKNVSFYIDASDKDNPVLRLENSEYFFKQNTVYQFLDIKELKCYSKSTKLYGTVKVGSQKLISGAAPFLSFVEGTSYYGWKEESYSPIGQCNLDQELNLVNEFAISSNMISNQIVGAVESNLDTLFMIQMSGVDSTLLEAGAVGFDYFGGGLPRYYNLGLNNVNKLQRHGNNFQTTVVNTQQAGGDAFHASLGTETLIGIQSSPGNPVNFPAFSFDFISNGVETSPVVFANEFGGNNFDAGGNYSNAGPLGGQYLVPLPGDYSFSANLPISVINLKSCVNFGGFGGANVTVPSSIPGLAAGTYSGANVYYGVAARVTIEAYSDNTLTTLIASQSVINQTISNGGGQLACTLVASLTPGNVVIAKVETYFFRYISGFMTNSAGQNVFFDGIVPLSWSTSCTYSSGEPKVQMFMGENSYFECNGTPDGGVTVASNDPSKFAINVWEFEYPIPVRDFEAIKANPIGIFTFEKDGIFRQGWIETMKRNDQTGLTQIKLITQSDATISN